MTVSITDFWKAAAASRLLSMEKCQQLHANFARIPGAEQGNSATLAEWLIDKKVLSRYQAEILRAGQPGPFVFGTYRVYDRIETGRLAGLFKAAHPESRHPVLLYFLSGAATQDPTSWQRIVRQVEAAARVQHPNLSRVYECVDIGAYKFAVVEDLSGKGLADRLSGKAVAPAEACRIAWQVAMGLGQMHAAGQAHGQVRLENLWLETGRNIKLLQGPVVSDPSQPAELTLEAADYLAPEMTQPGRAADVLSDIYSLGCTLYQLLSGKPPFAGGDLASKAHRHANDPIEPLERISGVTPQMAKVVAYMMAKNTRVRLQSAAIVTEALAPFLPPDANTLVAAVNPSLLVYESLLRKQPAAGSSAAPQPAPVASRPQPIARPQPIGASAPTSIPTNIPTSIPAGIGNSPVATAERVTAPIGMPQPKPLAAAAPAAGANPFGGIGTQPNSTWLPNKSPSAVAAPKQKMKPETMITIGLGAVLALVVVAGIWFATRSHDKDAAETTPVDTAAIPAVEEPTHPVDASQSANSAKNSDAPKSTDKKPPGEQVAVATNVKTKPATAKVPEKSKPLEVEDDGQTLWVSPTTGEPINLRYLPSGGQVFLLLRPAEILHHAEGPKIWAALGPAGDMAKADIESISGVALDQIEQMVLGIYPQENGQPKGSFVFRLLAPLDAASPPASWNSPSATKEGDVAYLQSSNWCYYLPAADAGKTLVVTSLADIKEVVTSSEPPLLRREMEKLVRDTDGSRHFTLLAAPSYVFTEGDSLFAGNLARLKSPLSWFLGDNVQALEMSAHLGNEFFAEMRAYGALDQDPYELAKRYRDRLASMPDEVEKYYVTLNPHPYGRLVLTRFPQMIRLMENYTRIGEENKQAVLRCYLPSPAGHNLVMASELVLAEQPGAAAVAVAGGSTPKKPTTAAEALKQKISLSFPRDTLEKTMVMLATEIDWEIVILGGDLQLEGITKNQSFGLDERDKPADEILRTVMQKANPDGKLIYIFKPKNPGEKDVIFITTRASAAKRNDKIPPELEAK